MARYRVLEAKCGVGRGGIACGPVGGPVVAEIKLSAENGGEFYLCLAEVDGIPNWFKTDRSTIDEQLSDEAVDELYDYLNDNYADIGEYEEVFDDTDALGNIWMRWRFRCLMRKRSIWKRWKRIDEIWDWAGFCPVLLFPDSLFNDEVRTVKQFVV